MRDFSHPRPALRLYLDNLHSEADRMNLISKLPDLGIADEAEEMLKQCRVSRRDILLTEYLTRRFDLDETLRYLALHLIIMTRGGHVRVPMKRIAEDVVSWLFPPGQEHGDVAPLPERIQRIIASLSLEEAVRRRPDLFGKAGDSRLFIYTSDFSHLYLPIDHYYEIRFLASLEERLAAPVDPRKDAERNRRVKDFFGQVRDFSFTPSQKEAIQRVLQYNFLVVVGGPGTGKTTTAVNLLRSILAFQRKNEDISLAVTAPTGKAAKRLEQSIRQVLDKHPFARDIDARLSRDSQGRTLHQLLKIGYRRHRSPYSPDHPLPHDVILVDEASMVDIRLMTWLFEAASGAKLILLGDGDQLPAVESGTILRDLIGGSPGQMEGRVVRLEGSHRFSESAALGRLADAVRRGDEKTFFSIVDSEPEATLIEADERTVESHIIDLIKNPVEVGESCRLPFSREQVHEEEKVFEEVFHRLEQMGILSAIKVGPLGTRHLNAAVERACADTPIYPGKPLVITRNDYDLNLYNGDRGVIFEFLSRGRKKEGRRDLAAVFAAPPDWIGKGRYRILSLGRLPPFDTGYVLTIHKSQGSEFDDVAVILPESGRDEMSRELLYTALTRAKKSCLIFASRDVLSQVIHRKTERHSGIRAALTDESKTDKE